MANETLITVVGNLTRDPELRFTQAGAAFVQFTVAQTPVQFDGHSRTWIDLETAFFKCSAWHELAKHFAGSCVKGSRVIVCGLLRARTFQVDGARRTQLEIRVTDAAPSLKRAVARVGDAQASNYEPAGVVVGDPWEGLGDYGK